MNTAPFSSTPSHTFREKATFEDFPIKPTSEGIKEAKLSSLFVLNIEQLPAALLAPAATTSRLGTKYHVSMLALTAKPNTSQQKQNSFGFAVSICFCREVFQGIWFLP